MARSGLVADAVVCNVDLPVAYRTLLGGVDAPRVARRGRFAPSCLLWVAGVRGAPPAGVERHNLHFGDQWQDAFKAVLRRGVRMSDPSMLIADAVARRSDRSTRGLLDPLRARADAEPRRQDRLGPRRRTARRRSPAPGRPARVLRATWWSTTSSTRSTGRRWVSSVARRSGSATRSVSPARSGRTTSTIVCPVWCSSARRPCRASACRWCLLSGKLAADRVDQFASATSVLRW